jgi:hypothetical protein
MWRRSIRIILALGLLIALCAQNVNLPGLGHLLSARAAGTLNLTKTTGIPSTVVGVSAASGTFDNSAQVSITFKDSANVTTALEVVTSNATGGLDSTNIVIPAGAATGLGVITGIENTPNNKTAVANFTVSTAVQPTNIAAIPSNAAVGQNVQITGSGFTPNGGFTVTIGSVTANFVAGASATADGNGNISTLVTVPPVSVGTQTVVVRDSVSGLTGSTSNFYVTSGGTGTATLTVSPNSGTPSITGSTVNTITINASGLPQSAQQITSLNLIDASGNARPLTSVSNNFTTSSGTYNATASLPTAAVGGSGQIQLTVNSTVVTTPFQINPALTVNGQAGPISQPVPVLGGQSVQIAGAGYKANTTINLFINYSTQLASVTTDVNGNLSTTATIPTSLSSGSYYISSSDLSNLETAQVYVTVTAGTVTPSATFTPTATATPTWTPFGYIAPTATPTWTPIGYITPTATPSATPAVQSTVTTDYFAEGYTGQAATNGKATFTEVFNILNPSSSAATATITYYIQDSTTPVVVTRQIAASAMLRESVNSDVGPDKLVAAVITSPQALVTTRTMTRVSASNSRLDGSNTQPTYAPATFWAFPEGYTGISFQEYLTLLNPNSAPATVSLVLAPQADSAAGARTSTLTVPAYGRTTTSIRALNAGNNAKSVGMLLTSNVPIVAERVEYFGDGAGSGKFGSSVSRGFTTPATDLRIPYATSGGAAPDSQGQMQPEGDQAYVTLLNPSTGGGPAQVTVGFGNSQGQPVGQPVQVSVAPGTRQTVIVNTSVGTAAVGPLSISVSSPVGIMAECAQYYGGSPNIGSHPGIVTPAFSGANTDAFLSDLSTQLSDGTALQRMAYIYNPGTSSEQVSITYYGQTGSTAQAQYVVPAGGISAVNVNTDTQSTIPPGAVGAEIKISTGSTGSFIASSVGKTVDNLSAIEDVGVPLP